MKLAAVVAEYDPFHNGHAQHLLRTREAGCDAVAVIMDGHLTQRGRFASLSRWDRARAALMNGADLVAELPALFACRTADRFADAGVALACALGADVLSFGCETEDLGLLQALADLKESPELIRVLREHLKRGEAYPRAYAAAVAYVLETEPERLPTGPNAILAVEYLRALRRRGGNVPRPLPILRKEGYHDPSTGRIASAEAIRGAIGRGERAEAEEGLPENARFQTECMLARHGIDDLILDAVRNRAAGELRMFPDVNEGLEFRLLRVAATAPDTEHLLEALKCKRYTRTRLERLLAHAVSGLTTALAESVPVPSYLRLTGIRREGPGGALLKERAALPVKTAAQLREDLCFRYECRVTDLWALGRDRTEERRAGQEFTRGIVVV